MFRCSVGLLVGMAAIHSLAAAASAGAPHYHVAARYAIGGSDTGYDYLTVDPESRRVFVAHGTRIEVLNADDGARLGQIEGLAGAHGIQFAPGTGHGFATSGKDRTVVMFDSHSLEVLRRIGPTGDKPDALEHDPASGLLFVVNGGSSGDLTVIDPRSGDMVKTLDVKGGKLEEIAFDGRGRGYVNDEKKNLIHVIDTKAVAEVGTWPLAPGEEPTGLAIDPAAHRIFAACGNKLLVAIDLDSGKVAATAPIGADPDGAVFEPKTHRIFVPNSDGTLTVVRASSPDKLLIEQTVQSGPHARTIALDEKTGRLFLTTAEYGPAPQPTATNPEPRAPMLPESFAVLVVAP